MTHFRAATIDIYVDWLKQYCQNGGRPTHYYEYPWLRAKFLLARKNFTLDGECGAASRPILVPYDVEFLGGSLGHNNLYFQRDYSCMGGWVPVYQDLVFLREISELAEFISDEQKRDREIRQQMHSMPRYDSDLSRFTGR